MLFSFVLFNARYFFCVRQSLQLVGTCIFLFLTYWSPALLSFCPLVLRLSEQWGLKRVVPPKDFIFIILLYFFYIFFAVGYLLRENTNISSWRLVTSSQWNLERASCPKAPRHHPPLPLEKNHIDDPRCTGVLPLSPSAPRLPPACLFLLFSMHFFSGALCVSQSSLIVFGWARVVLCSWIIFFSRTRAVPLHASGYLTRRELVTPKLCSKWRH